MGNNFDIETLVNNNKRNKYSALTGVFVALLFSCVMIGVGFHNYVSTKPILDKTIVTKCSNDAQRKKLSCDTTCCALLHKMECTPIDVTENNYNNTAYILLYSSILIFISLSLCGAFIWLFKVLKSENDMNTKILDVQKELYKETQMWELAKTKKEFELKS